MRARWRAIRIVGHSRRTVFTSRAIEALGAAFDTRQLAIFDALAKSHAENAVWQSELSIRYDKVGRVQVAQGSLTAALQSYLRCLAIQEDLTKLNPNNTLWQSDLALTYGQLGKVQFAQANLTDALQSYSAEIAIMERLTKTNPNDTGWQFNLAGSYYFLATVYRQSNDRDDALAALQQSKARTDIAVGYNRDYGCAPSTATILNFAYFSPILCAASYSGE